jgi:hypothetical protein
MLLIACSGSQSHATSNKHVVQLTLISADDTEDITSLIIFRLFSVRVLLLRITKFILESETVRDQCVVINRLFNFEYNKHTVLN